MNVMLGRSDWIDDKIDVEVLRDESSYWTGKVKIRINEKGGRGRKNTGAGKEEWEAGDKLRLRTCSGNFICILHTI